MSARPRQVLPEGLDALPPDDRHARRSRADLRRLHRVMGSAGALVDALRTLPAARRVLELGAGDGTLLLRVARRLQWRNVELTLLDRVNLLDASTRAAYARLGWTVRVLQRCVLDWANDREAAARFDVCVASLFLHHFEPAALSVVLRAVAARSDAVVAIEPRRSTLAAVGSRMIALLGANAVTRADAITSVNAGFAGHELTATWPVPRAWRIEERPCGPFLHRFVARRAAGSDDGDGNGR